MHPHIYSTPPTWLGSIFLVLGILILVISPKIVEWQITQVRRTNRWLLNLIGYDGEFVLSQGDSDPDNESGLARWRRSSYWFSTILIGLVFVGFGLAVLLNVKGVSIG